MKLENIHHVAIIASDYQKTREFYIDKLGFEVLAENYREKRGDYKLDAKSGNVQLEIFGMPNPPRRVTSPEACGLRHLAFAVNDIEAAVKELAEKGIECEPLRVDEFTGCRATFFRDPDALPLELYEV